jgi:undecaprenyl pyrophosphate phosphatase UppP
MTEGDPRDQISDLEAHIDALAETVESCRKLMLISKIAIAAGGIVVLAIALGAIRFDPMAVIAAMTAVIGGTVVFGSNMSTSQQASDRMKDAEARRAALIGRLELRVVDDGVDSSP